MAAVYSRQIFQLRGMETDMDNSISAASSVETFNEKKTFRGELALVIAVLINSFSVVLILACASKAHSRNMDIYFSGNSYFKPYDYEEKIRSDVPVQLRCRLRFQHAPRPE